MLVAGDEETILGLPSELMRVADLELDEDAHVVTGMTRSSR
jgi:hypothetical protein